MKKIITTLTLLQYLLVAQESILDKYHYKVSNWLLAKSDYLDKYLTDNNDTKHLSHTKVGISYEITSNSSGGISNNFDFSLSLSLPRFQNKMKLKLDKVKKNWNSIDDNGVILPLNSIQKDTTLDDSYNLGLEYSQWKGKRSSIKFTGGLRFSKIILEPYIGIIAGYKIYNRDRIETSIKNKLLFYTSGEIKNTSSLQYLYSIDRDNLIGVYAILEYSTDEDDQTIKSEFMWHRRIDNRSYFKSGFIATAKLTKFKNLKRENFELYSRYHNKFRDKDWLYFEITPAVDWKKEDNFKPSATLKLKVGATFGGRN